ncbi:hypothetical protein LguiA_029986 [Lonicera macranthoides]
MLKELFSHSSDALQYISILIWQQVPPVEVPGKNLLISIKKFMSASFKRKKKKNFMHKPCSFIYVI